MSPAKVRTFTKKESTFPNGIVIAFIDYFYHSYKHILVSSFFNAKYHAISPRDLAVIHVTESDSAD
ncbi:hypothetical protein G9P44_000035 [Scheffersomyces stipitis]|nr:hypothetical protein G9P44_000035 [Scheffersomyces stipitis]